MVRIRKNELINNIIGSYMQEQGVELFLVWKNPIYFEDYKKDFLHWYEREEKLGK